MFAVKVNGQTFVRELDHATAVYQAVKTAQFYRRGEFTATIVENGKVVTTLYLR